MHVCMSSVRLKMYITQFYRFVNLLVFVVAAPNNIYPQMLVFVPVKHTTSFNATLRPYK